WLGVGNVEGVLLRSDGSPTESIALRDGVVGYRLPPLRAEILSLRKGDMLVLATDGIKSDFKIGLDVESSPRALAESIHTRSGRTTDDACVIVARYLGFSRATLSIREESDV